jgi:hypothetical protein
VKFVCANLLDITKVVTGTPFSFRSIGRGVGVIVLSIDVDVALLSGSTIITFVASVGSGVAVSRSYVCVYVNIKLENTVCVVVSTMALRASVATGSTSKVLHVGVAHIILVVVAVNQQVAVLPGCTVLFESTEVLLEGIDARSGEIEVPLEGTHVVLERRCKVPNAKAG